MTWEEDRSPAPPLSRFHSDFFLQWRVLLSCLGRDHTNPYPYPPPHILHSIPPSINTKPNTALGDIANSYHLKTTLYITYLHFRLSNPSHVEHLRKLRLRWQDPVCVSNYYPLYFLPSVHPLVYHAIWSSRYGQVEYILFSTSCNIAFWFC